MKKTLTIIWLLLLSFNFLYAQITEPEETLRKKTLDTLQGWKTGVTLSVSATQTSFVNWAAGGQNSLALTNMGSIFAHYKKKNASWDNSFDVGYGVLRQGDDKIWKKTDDRIDLTSKFGKRASKKWYYAALLNFRTQFDAGYDYPNDSVKVSDFLAPAYIIGGLGMDYKPTDNFSAFIAPATSKTTIVNNQTLADKGAFGVEKAVIDEATGNIITRGEKVRSEFGGYIRLAYQKSNILENVDISTRLDLFSNYLDNPQNIDINWELLISMKINKYITVTLASRIIYDDDMKIGIDTNDDGVHDKFGPRTQYSQVIGVGLAYRFTN